MILIYTAICGVRICSWVVMLVITFDVVLVYDLARVCNNYVANLPAGPKDRRPSSVVLTFVG